MLLKNDKSGKVQAIPIEKVRKSFIFASGSTCHSAQGCGVDDKITNVDYNIIFLSRISLNGKIHH